MRSSEESDTPARAARPPEASPNISSGPARRLEGQEGVYEIAAAEPVILGRLSVFYPARDVRTGATVLVKSFREAPGDHFAIRAFYEELRAIRQLRHPHILEVLDYNPGAGPDAPPFLVLPWCRGGNLRQLKGIADFLPLSSVIAILEQVASAIDYAHQQGVIHGDVKPENVLLSDDRRHAYLADFGMAKFFDVSDQVSRSQEAPIAGGAGTSAFLSPEQLADNKQSPQSDIYSFALVAYELLTGRLPFDVAAPLYRQIHARVTGDLVDPGDANPLLSRSAQVALRYGLATNPRDRPTLAADLCRMLAGAAAVPKGRGARRSRKERVQGWWSSMRPSLRVAIITTAITVLGGIVTALIQIIPAITGSGK